MINCDLNSSIHFSAVTLTLDRTNCTGKRSEMPLMDCGLLFSGGKVLQGKANMIAQAHGDAAGNCVHELMLLFVVLPVRLARASSVSKRSCFEGIPSCASNVTVSSWLQLFAKAKLRFFG